MAHLLTIDVEDGRRSPAPDHQLDAALEPMLDLLAEAHASATFFVVGEDAAKVRRSVQRIVREGHGVACHGLHHSRVDAMGADRFRRDLRAARSLIEDVAQTPCRGFRAPWFSAAADLAWFFGVLAEEGLTYDSSLWQPLGTAGAPQRHASGVIEVPIPFCSVFGARVGILGGLGLRLLPPALIARALGRCVAVRQPACFYLHPYEWAPWRTRACRCPCAPCAGASASTAPCRACADWPAATSSCRSRSGCRPEATAPLSETAAVLPGNTALAQHPRS